MQCDRAIKPDLSAPLNIDASMYRPSTSNFITASKRQQLLLFKHAYCVL